MEFDIKAASTSRSAATADARHPPPTALKIMTSAIYPDSGLNTVNQIDWLIESIERESPDIITLQELNRNTLRRKFDGQAAVIAREVEMTHRNCDTILLEPEAVSLTTLSKYPFVMKRHKPLMIRRIKGLSGGLGNYLQLTESSRLYMFNVYLDHHALKRPVNTATILSKYSLLDQVLNDPILISGVFAGDALAADHDFPIHFQNASGTGAPSGLPEADSAKKSHIFVNRRLKPLDAYVIEPADPALHPAAISIVKLKAAI